MLRKHVLSFCKHGKCFENVFFHFVEMENASKTYFSFCTDETRFENVLFSFCKDAKNAQKICYFILSQIKNASKVYSNIYKGFVRLQRGGSVLSQYFLGQEFDKIQVSRFFYQNFYLKIHLKKLPFHAKINGQTILKQQQSIIKN